MPKLIDISRAAKYVGLSRTRLYQEIASGRLQTVKVGGRRLVTVTALDQLIERITSNGG